MLGKVNAEVSAWATERRTEIMELHEREQFRREFIGNLAHELKTPIFNIQGYILTLLEGGLEDPKVNRDFLNRASNGVDRLLKIVEDLDLITKLESGVMDLRTAPMDLHALVTETMHGMEINAREKGVTLKNELTAPTMVLADRYRLAQVFVNLFNNAINYGKAGGACTVSSYPLGEQVLVEVSDDGIGFPPDLDWRLDLLPVDFAADAIAQLAFLPNPDPVRAVHLAEILIRRTPKDRSEIAESR